MRYEDPGRTDNDALEPLTAFWFDEDELVRCLEENGFRVVKIIEMRTPVTPTAEAVCVWAERSLNHQDTENTEKVKTIMGEER